MKQAIAPLTLSRNSFANDNTFAGKVGEHRLSSGAHGKVNGSCYITGADFIPESHQGFVKTIFWRIHIMLLTFNLKVAG